MIRGEWGSRRVWVNDVELLPEASQEVWNHSPDGFAWGYAGSGPAQLALAIILHMTRDPELSKQLHQELKFDIIAGLPQADFELDYDKVADWITAKRMGICQST